MYCKTESELNFELKDSNNLRESGILINEIDTLESILGRLADLKYGKRVRAMEIAEADHDFRRAISRSSIIQDDSNNIHHEHIGDASKSDVSQYSTGR